VVQLHLYLKWRWSRHNPRYKTYKKKYDSFLDEGESMAKGALRLFVALCLLLPNTQTRASLSSEQLTVAGELRRLSYILRGIAPTDAEFEELSKLSPEDQKAYLSKQRDMYLQSEAFRAQVATHYSEMMRLSPNYFQVDTTSGKIGTQYSYSGNSCATPQVGMPTNAGTSCVLTSPIESDMFGFNPTSFAISNKTISGFNELFGDRIGRAVALQFDLYNFLLTTNAGSNRLLVAVSIAQNEPLHLTTAQAVQLIAGNFDPSKEKANEARALLLQSWNLLLQSKQTPPGLNEVGFKTLIERSPKAGALRLGPVFRKNHDSEAAKLYSQALAILEQIEKIGSVLNSSPIRNILKIPPGWS
jgi:hypothetical protein